MLRDRAISKALAAIVLAGLLAGCASSSGTKKVSQEQKDDNNAAEVYARMGQDYLSQGQLEIAFEKLSRALELNPRLYTAHTVMGVLFERLGKPEKAESHYKLAVELAPENGSVLNNYGTFLCHTGKLDLAVAHFLKAGQDPFYKTPELPLANAGHCLMGAGRVEEAEANFRQALKHNPNNSDALLRLAEILFGKQEFFRSRAFIQRYEAAAPATAESLELARQIEIKLGDKAAAAEYLQRLRKEFPDAPQTRALDQEKQS